jgi:hypothetical protein
LPRPKRYPLCRDLGLLRCRHRARRQGGRSKQRHATTVRYDGADNRHESAGPRLCAPMRASSAPSSSATWPPSRSLARSGLKPIAFASSTTGSTAGRATLSALNLGWRALPPATNHSATQGRCGPTADGMWLSLSCRGSVWPGR